MSPVLINTLFNLFYKKQVIIGEWLISIQTDGTCRARTRVVICEELKWTETTLLLAMRTLNRIGRRHAVQPAKPPWDMKPYRSTWLARDNTRNRRHYGRISRPPTERPSAWFHHTRARALIDRTNARKDPDILKRISTRRCIDGRRSVSIRKLAEYDTTRSDFVFRKMVHIELRKICNQFARQQCWLISVETLIKEINKVDNADLSEDVINRAIEQCRSWLTV